MGWEEMEEEMTRQREYQLRQRAKGLCELCNKPLFTKCLCLEHAVKHREAARRRNKCKLRYYSKTYRGNSLDLKEFLT